MVNRKQKELLQYGILILYGLYHIYDQWTKILVPFTQWQLEPRPELFHLLLLNSIGNTAILIGGFFIAQIIDTAGCKKTAILVTVLTALYQMIISKVSNFYVFGVLQLLLIANHMPMVTDALIAKVVGEDGDDKQRASLIMRLTVPQSIAFAAGPYLAIQILYILSPSLTTSQFICGLAHLITVIPLILLLVPEEDSHSHRSVLPSLTDYFDIMRDSEMKWALLFLMFVAAPFSSYDQVIRASLSSHMLFHPGDMAKLALLLGVTTLVGNMIVLPRLQSKLGPQALLQVSMALLFLSYLFLSQYREYSYLLIGMPVQALGVCMAYGQLSGQILGRAGHGNVGKAAALNRGAQLIATAMAPLITGYYIDTNESQLLCYLNAVITLVGIGLVHKFGGFMRSHFQNLPLRVHNE
uniref:MFS domain-containing protein n=1 Tax=Syphacia muris TaxID=451379 RepID=A0A0N5AAM5_9BILA